MGRWGGDEFAIVIDSSPDHAMNFPSRLQQWVFGEYTVSNGEESAAVGVSAALGMAFWDGAESAAELFNRADRLMYADKRTICTAEASRVRRGRSFSKAG